jgi:hypothetical protein
LECACNVAGLKPALWVLKPSRCSKGDLVMQGQSHDSDGGRELMTSSFFDLEMFLSAGGSLGSSIERKPSFVLYKQGVRNEVRSVGRRWSCAAPNRAQPERTAVTVSDMSTLPLNEPLRTEDGSVVVERISDNLLVCCRGIFLAFSLSLVCLLFAHSFIYCVANSSCLLSLVRSLVLCRPID